MDLILIETVMELTLLHRAAKVCVEGGGGGGIGGRGWRGVGGGGGGGGIVDCCRSRAQT